MDQDSDLTEKALESVDEQVTANEDDEKKYYWGVSSPKEVRELREEYLDEED